MIRKAFLALLVASGLVFGSSNQVEAKGKCGKGSQVAGAIVGGVLGGLLGRKADGGQDRTAGTLIGGAVGAFVGAKIGQALDKCEKAQMAKATQDALDGKAFGAGSSQSWSSESREGVNGSVQASKPTKLADGRICRSVTQVNYIEGQEMQDKPRYCQTPPNKAWTPA